jgi:hypothetical protein
VVEDANGEPAAQQARAFPIRPEPTTPRVLWRTSWPSIISGPQVHGALERRKRSPSAIRLAAAIIKANAVSAVVSVSTSGVSQARTPCLVQASTSMLSKPTA